MLIKKLTGDVGLDAYANNDCINLVTHDILADRIRLFTKENCVNTGGDA